MSEGNSDNIFNTQNVEKETFDRLCISLSPNIKKKILDFCKQEDMKISTLLRKSALLYIKNYGGGS